MTSPVVMGLDPSLRSTGVAFLSAEGWQGVYVISDTPSDTLAERVYRLGLDLAQLLAEHQPSLCLMEQGFSSAVGPSAWKLGAAAGAFMVALHDAGVPVAMVAPKVRAKLATGKGIAKKVDVIVAARERLGYQGTSDDEADAMWLAVGALAIAGHQYCPLPKTHLEVLRGLIPDA